MNYQSFISVSFLFILTINFSLTLPYFDQTYDISKHNLDQFDKNSLQKISDEYDNIEYKPKWRRSTYSQSNLMNKYKAGSRVPKYDLLLHRWILRKTTN